MVSCLNTDMHWSPCWSWQHPLRWGLESTQNLLLFQHGWAGSQLVGQASGSGSDCLSECKFYSKLEPVPVIWQSLSKDIPEDNWEFWIQNSMEKLLLQHSSTAWPGVAAALQHSLAMLNENIIILQGLVTWKQCFLFHPILLSFIGLWVKIGHRNKSARCKYNPVQNSRSKLTTWLRQGFLLRFQMNSTTTSDSSAQNWVGNYLCNDSKSIATKVFSQTCSKWKATFETYVKTCI